MRLFRILVAVAAIWGLSVTAQAAVIVTGGLDASYPTMNRVSDRSGFPVSANTSLPYEVLEIRTTSAGDTLTATMGNTTQFDSFLALYSSFNPAAPQSNILAADDDSAGYPHAQLTKTGLAANTTYYLVITSYASGADAVYPQYGSYSLTLGGNFTVVQKATTTTLGASVNPVTQGQEITLAAVVTKSGTALPTGTVTFKEGSTTLGTGTVSNGLATFSTSALAVGSHAITAFYGGDLKNSSSTSAALTVVVAEAQKQLTVAIVGSGSVISDPVGISCAAGNSSGCAAVFDAGSTVVLTATGNTGFDFSIWSGACTGGNGCSVLMDTDRSVTSTFTVQNNVKVNGTSYGTLNDAYLAAGDGATLMARDLTFVEDLLVNRGIGIILQGGYADGFGSHTGYTTLHGVLTVSSGSVVLDNLKIK
ncbi:Ig-like domain (group 3) [Trichlorobacter thiogenes]|uniref:Ig-like domain (Group 3) n=1 Tax=Trichlorobacter thiogenes TaxID=115783 RepID=A0A1T4QHC7_9BACT|nr:Ig-like domain-containing protein [Trichlorobacter thiogenes]SKA02881.1 Ig-like domain (group 3) [Trichlorobacter thiogenes]